jgi:cytochrome c-type biogenesis protein CcmH
MSLALLGWLLIVASIAITALLIFPLPAAGALSLRSRLRSSTSSVAAAGILFVAGVGAATSGFWAPSASDDATALSEAHSETSSEMLASLKDYTRSIGGEQPASAATPDKLLPDVVTMVERLAARLETAPKDVKGWRMLGWSYFNMGQYKQAAAAYARAVELEPNSADLKRSYEDAKAKAAESETASPLQTQVAAKGGEGHGVEKDAKPKNAKSEGGAPDGQDAAIRAMVDGLAHRLEQSPRDVDGWTRLMRSRVVLGEKEVAVSAFRKALEVFKDDSAATGKIRAAAIELGLKAE